MIHRYGMGNFKNWLSLHEIASNPMSPGVDTSPAAQAATKRIGDDWMKKPTNAPAQVALMNNRLPKPQLQTQLMQSAAQAVQNAPATTGQQTNAGMVARYLQPQLGLDNILPKPPTQQGIR